MKLLITDIKDETERENMKRIEKEFNFNQPLLFGKWKFFSIVFTKAVTNFKFAHNLSFVPTDVIQTSLIGAGALTWNYSLFDKTYLNITTTGACTVRAFVGAYSEKGNYY